MLAHDQYNVELNIFLEAVKQRFGYDFTDYARGSLKRRIQSLQSELGVNSISEMVYHVFHNENFLPIALSHLSVQFSEMFRDPHFYHILRKEVIPVLKTYPALNIWIAGCSTGEEAYSTAILLHEEGLLERSHIYATDISRSALETASEGVYPNDLIDSYEVNYIEANGRSDINDYFVSRYDLKAVCPSLKKNIIFSEHNLSVDGVFCEMHLVICRNVLIYFNKNLQNKCIQLFSDSLIRQGYLGLGEKESLDFSDAQNQFNKISNISPIFRKKAAPKSHPKLTTI